jgi:beta-lactamase superfamily II metal-dependent hydrolase
VFKLEALSAKHGDALLLHYGKGKIHRLILIDGGPAGVYRLSVRPRLQQLGGGVTVALRMVMVSHLDADHISGVLDMFADLRKAREKGDAPPYDIATLWVNTFKEGLAATGVVKPAELASGVSLASLGDGIVPRGLQLDDDVLADLASVQQGVRLRDDAKALGTSTNDPFEDLVMAPASGAKKVSIGDGLSLTVVAPSAQRIEALKADWAKKTKAKKVSPAELAAYVDESVYNLSSIVVLATFGRKRMLLTGDARGDDILAALRAAKLLKGSSLHVDLLKVPHHGSERNVEQEFFEQVTADHYVISADGKHGNPDVGMLKMLTQARGADTYTIWFTNKVQRVANFLSKDAKKDRNYRVEYRDRKALFIEVALAT